MRGFGTIIKAVGSYLRFLRGPKQGHRKAHERRRKLGFDSLEQRTMLSILTWSPQIGGPGGTWDADTHNWLDEAGSRTAWLNGYTAVFATQAAYQVDVSGNINLAGITFRAGSCHIAVATGGGTFTLYGTNTLALDDQHTQTVGDYTVINDTIETRIYPNGTAGALVKSNTGTVSLTNADNSFPDGITLNGGTLNVAAGALGSARIEVNATTADHTAALVFQSSASYSNPITINSGSTLRLDLQGNSVTIGGDLDGSGNLVVSDTQGNGALYLTGTGNGEFTGPTTIKSGTLVLGSGSSISNSHLTIDGGTLNLAASYAPTAAITFNSGDIDGVELDLAYVNLTANVALHKTAFVSAKITGDGGVAVEGTGPLFLLASDNDYEGDTTVDSGATLVYRWNDGDNGYYSISPASTRVIEEGGYVKSEYDYFHALDANDNFLVWQGGTGNYWDTTNQYWYQPGATGPTTAHWIASKNPVFEEPVSGNIIVNGTVTVGTTITFMMGSDRIVGGSSNDKLSLDKSNPTEIHIDVPNTSEFFDVAIACDLNDNNEPRGGLTVINHSNVFLGHANSDYHGTTTLDNGAIVNFVPGGLGNQPIDVTAGANGSAALVFANPNQLSSLTLTNAIDIVSGTLQIDTANQAVTLSGAISGSGKLELNDSSGGGTMTLSRPGSQNSYTGGTVISSGTYIAGSNELVLGPVPSSATANIFFAGNGFFRWGSGVTLSANRGIEIEANSTANLDTQGETFTINSVISGDGNLTIIGSGTVTLGVENSFSGVTTVATQGGTLRLTSPLALEYSTFETTGAGYLSFDGLSHATFGGLQGSRDFVLPFDLTVGENNTNTTMSGALFGGGSLFKVGTGTLSLTGTTNSFTGHLKVFNGTVDVKTLADSGMGCNGMYAITMGSADDETDGSLKFSGSSAATTARNIDVQMDSSLDASGTADLVLGGLIGGEDGPGLTLRGTGTGVINGYTSNNETIGITGMYSVIKEDAGTWILNAADSYSHHMEVNGGTVAVNHPLALTPGKDLRIGRDGHVMLASGLSQAIQLGGLTITGGEGSENNMYLMQPVLTSIACVGQDLVAAESVDFAVTFNHDVVGVDASDFALDCGEGVTGEITAVSGSGRSYTVTVGNIAGDGSLALEFVNDGSVTDQAGNPLRTTAATQDRSTTRLTTSALDGIEIQPALKDEVFTVNHNLWWVGGSGDWDTGPNWKVGGPDGPRQTWLDGSDATLAGPAAVIQIVNPITARALTFVSSGYVVSGSTLTLDGQTVVDVEGATATINCDIAGNGGLEKTGTGTLLMTGHNTYQGGTHVAQGTLALAEQAASLLYNEETGGLAYEGPGTVVVVPSQILYWTGAGDWNTGTWQTSSGDATPWIDGSCAFIAAGSTLNVSAATTASAITFAGSATIAGDPLTLPPWGTTITVQAGTATISADLSGGTLTVSGPGTLDLEGSLAAPPVVLAGRVIGPGSVFSADGTSLAALDSDVFNVVRQDASDHVLDRAEMIAILLGTANDGQVSDGEVAALQAVVQNADKLGVPDYVEALASDVVLGNRANAWYQGQSLGNLQEASTATERASRLQTLVNKWFYGIDHPVASAYATYATVAGPLFGDNAAPALNVPSVDDMQQGSLADCYFIAAIGSICKSSPAAIENMWIDNGVENGRHTYSVRFYYYDAAAARYVADFETVDDLLPSCSYPGQLLYARPTDNKWFLPLLEKAYAQFNETGHEGRNGQNTYESLGWGWMNAVDEQILGRATTTYSASQPGAKQALIDALASNEAVSVGAFLNGDAETFHALKLVSSHAYAVVGYDNDPTSATYDTVQLKNPWGAYQPEPIPWENFVIYCGGFVVADATGTVPAAPGLLGAAPAIATDIVNVANPAQPRALAHDAIVETQDAGIELACLELARCRVGARQATIVRPAAPSPALVDAYMASSGP